MDFLEIAGRFFAPESPEITLKKNTSENRLRTICRK